jgi:3-dehydroquinate synthase
LARERVALAHAVRRSCELKARVVAEDERETGLRAILNFGHTFGHAFEAGVGYGQWLHGEAVAAGMVMAAELSVRAGLLDRSAAGRIRALLERAGLPVAGPTLNVDQLLGLMRLDKKVSSGRLRFVLLSDIGKALVRDDIDERLVREAIAACTPTPVAAARQ